MGPAGRGAAFEASLREAREEARVRYASKLRSGVPGGGGGGGHAVPRSQPHERIVSLGTLKARHAELETRAHGPPMVGYKLGTREQPGARVTTTWARRAGTGAGSSAAAQAPASAADSVLNSEFTYAVHSFLQKRGLQRDFEYHIKTWRASDASAPRLAAANALSMAWRGAQAATAATPATTTTGARAPAPTTSVLRIVSAPRVSAPTPVAAPAPAPMRPFATGVGMAATTGTGTGTGKTVTISASTATTTSTTATAGGVGDSVGHANGGGGGGGGCASPSVRSLARAPMISAVRPSASPWPTAPTAHQAKKPVPLSPPYPSSPPPSPPSPPSDAEFARILEKLRAPIAACATRRDEAPWDTVDVCGYTIHRFECRHEPGDDGAGTGAGAGASRRDVIGLVSSELAALLGEQRLDEMRSQMAPSARGADIRVDGRIFSALQRAGVGSARVRTRRDSAQALERAPPLTNLSIALALMRLRRYRIVTLARTDGATLGKRRRSHAANEL